MVESSCDALSAVAQDGLTPLHLAAESPSDGRMVELLLQSLAVQMGPMGIAWWLLVVRWWFIVIHSG